MSEATVCQDKNANPVDRQPIFTPDSGQGFSRIQFGDTGFKIVVRKTGGGNYSGEIDFLPGGEIQPKPANLARNARYLCNGLLGLYELTNNGELLQSWGLDGNKPIDLSMKTNERLVCATRELFQRFGHPPEKFTPVNGDTVYVRWSKLKDLEPNDPLVEYLHKVAERK